MRTHMQTHKTHSYISCIQTCTHAHMHACTHSTRVCPHTPQVCKPPTCNTIIVYVHFRIAEQNTNRIMMKPTVSSANLTVSIITKWLHFKV